MRFCPFCGVENQDEATHCDQCARRLPPLPERRKHARTGGPNLLGSDPTGEGFSLSDNLAALREETNPSLITQVEETTPREAAASPDAVTRLEGRPMERGRSSTMSTRGLAVPGNPPTLPKVQELAIPAVDPVPEIPEAGLVPAVRYTLGFGRARWQRRRAIKVLRVHIRGDTTQLDTVLGALGRQVRAIGVNSPAIESENKAIDEAEEKQRRAEIECAQLDNRQAEENSRFGDIEADRQAKLNEATAALEKAQKEVATLEAEQRSLRETKRQIERQQRTQIRAAEEKEQAALKHDQTEGQIAFRRAAEEIRREAASLEPQKQDLDRRLAAMEKPAAHAVARVEALRGELEACRRSLNDAREGHRHRLAELDGESARRSRELAQAEAEIQRRLVTLGTLVNLNRIEGPEFSELYNRIDELRTAISARSNDIDRLSAEREAYDRPALIRGAAALSGLFLIGLLILGILLSVF